MFNVENVLLLCLVSMLASATFEDLRKHKIPNYLVGIGLIVGISMNSVVDGGSGALRSLCGICVGLVTLLPFYMLRGMGAGDVKLMAAIGGFIGPISVLYAAVSTLILGGVLGALWIVWKLATSACAANVSPIYTMLFWQNSLVTVRRERFPYALAITGGTLIALWLEFDVAVPGAFAKG